MLVSCLALSIVRPALGHACHLGDLSNYEQQRHRYVKDRERRRKKCVLKFVTLSFLRKYFSTEKEKLPPLSDVSDDSDDEDLQESSQGGEPSAKRPRLSDTVTTPASSKKHDVTLLTAQMIRDHMREVWNQDAVLLRRLYSSLATSPSQNPIDIFFLDIVPVPPSRFRPVSCVLVWNV